MNGNWSGYLTKASGGTTLNQSRSHNLVNEIDTDNTHGDSDNWITESIGTAWADPVHDAAGNMTTMPSPLGLATGLTLATTPGTGWSGWPTVRPPWPSTSTTAATSAR